MNYSHQHSVDGNPTACIANLVFAFAARTFREGSFVLCEPNIQTKPFFYQNRVKQISQLLSCYENQKDFKTVVPRSLCTCFKLIFCAFLAILFVLFIYFKVGVFGILMFFSTF